jgi:hypothetical protein
MFPPGLAPQAPDAAGLPDYLTSASKYFPSPNDRSPEGEQDDTLFADATSPTDLNLDEKGSHKLKCPKCDTVQSAKNKKCTQCGHDLAEARKAKFANLSEDAGEVDDNSHSALLFQTGIPLNLSSEPGEDGLFWKVACKTGTLALSPGPGQMDMDQPLQLTQEMFDDLVAAYNEKAFPYVTVPETHSNGSLENTGYVKALEKVSKEQLLADERIQPEGRELLAGDPDDTEYLLAGIHFTKAKAKESAEDGSLADTSVGVKFNYRNKRTGKLYRAALEHLALTSVPWVDGLTPFNSAAALGQQPFDQDEDDEFDGVFVELELAGKPPWLAGKEATGDAGPKQAAGAKKKCPECGTINKADAKECKKCQHSLVGNKAKQKVNASQRVERSTDGEHFFETTNDMMALGMSVHLRGDRYDDIDIDLEKANGVLAALGSGDRLDLPFGIGIRRVEDDGESEDSGSLFLVECGYEGDVKLSRSAGSALSKAVAEMHGRYAKEQAERVKYGGPQVAYSQDEGTADLELADLTEKGRQKAASKGQALPGGGFPITNEADLKKAIRAIGRAKNPEAAKAHIKKRAKALGLEHLIPDSWKQGNLSQDGAGDSPQDLSSHGESDSLVSDPDEDYHMPREDIPESVEQLLARQQAELEALQARLESSESNLSLAQNTITNQGRQLHLDNVAKKVESYKRQGMNPALLLAVQTVLEGDAPGRESTDEGLNLSVKSGDETKTLQTPTEIVEFLLSAMPTDSAAEASRLAAISEGLGDWNLAQDREANGSLESREVQARQLVDEWERERYPDRFNDDGSRKTAVA